MNRVSGVWRMALVAAVFAVAGCGGQKAGGAAAGGAATGSAAPGEVAIEVTEAGFVPAIAEVPKGQAVTLVMTRKTTQTCATEMVFAANGEKHALPLNQAVRIELPADHADTLAYACGMDMIKGQIVAK